MAWPISNCWDGLDGKWSTWNITVGIPSQSFRVLASTNISELTLPFASAYLTDPQALVCGSSRGVRHSYGYSPNGSQYWDARGGSDMMYNFIDVEEEFAKIPQPSSLWPDLGTKLTGLYTPAEEDHGWPSNHPGLVSGWRSKVEEADPNEGAFLGAIGLKAIPSRHWMWPTGRHYYWSWDNIQRSMIQRLTGDTELTMGYAYTPGAHYRKSECTPNLLSVGVHRRAVIIAVTPSQECSSVPAFLIYRSGNTHGSLSMGYYNPSLLTLDARSFPFSPPDDSLNLTILSISVSQSLHTRSKYSLLASPLYSTILDSTSPFLILPEIICRRFQHSFGLQYEASSGLFLVNSSNHLRLKEMNPSFTFELAGPEHKKNTENENDRGGDTLKITLPYESFDLFIKRSWDDDEPRAYFPIKIAKPGADNVLGRSFLQEV